MPGHYTRWGWQYGRFYEIALLIMPGGGWEYGRFYENALLIMPGGGVGNPRGEDDFRFFPILP